MIVTKIWTIRAKHAIDPADDDLLTTGAAPSSQRQNDLIPGPSDKPFAIHAFMIDRSSVSSIQRTLQRCGMIASKAEGASDVAADALRQGLVAGEDAGLSRAAGDDAAGLVLKVTTSLIG